MPLAFLASLSYFASSSSSSSSSRARLGSAQLSSLLALPRTSTASPLLLDFLRFPLHGSPTSARCTVTALHAHFASLTAVPAHPLFPVAMSSDGFAPAVMVRLMKEMRSLVANPIEGIEVHTRARTHTSLPGCC